MEKSLSKAERELLGQFLESRLMASRSPSLTVVQGIWSSRVALGQWILIVAVFAWFAYLIAGQSGAVVVAAIALGALLAQIAFMRGSIARWPVTERIIDWDKIQSRLADDIVKPDDSPTSDPDGSV